MWRTASHALPRSPVAGMLLEAIILKTSWNIQRIQISFVSHPGFQMLSPQFSAIPPPWLAAPLTYTGVLLCALPLAVLLASSVGTPS